MGGTNVLEGFQGCSKGFHVRSCGFQEVSRVYLRFSLRFSGVSEDLGAVELVQQHFQVHSKDFRAS